MPSSSSSFPAYNANEIIVLFVGIHIFVVYINELSIISGVCSHLTVVVLVVAVFQFNISLNVFYFICFYSSSYCVCVCVEGSIQRVTLVVVFSFFKFYFKLTVLLVGKIEVCSLYTYNSDILIVCLFCVCVRVCGA